MKLKTFVVLIILSNQLVFSQTTSGELKRWHKISLSFIGPLTSETADPNPFTDYRLTVTFRHIATNTTHEIPGFYSGCDDPAENSCDSGNVWKVNFSPEHIGTWNWSVSFTTGPDVSINGGGSSAGFMDNTNGNFIVEESDKTGRDHRSTSKGRTQYVGEHYLRFAGTNPENPNGDWFVKAGADAPENTLAYDDFDNTPNRGGRRKSWDPHQRDYVASDAENYTWNNGNGTELLGVVNYLANKGVNAFSFLTFSLHGDDQNVFPHLLRVSESVYNGYGNADQWNRGIYRDRFDVSKLAQWERIFEYADKRGIYMHFKTLEHENDNLMDNDSFGRERKLYYRELIARFGHHLALNWNLAEESTISDDVVIETANYISDLDSYNHNIVMHTYIAEKTLKYTPLLGNRSALTGASIQSQKADIHDDIKEWVINSRNAGKKWIVANDEQGTAQTGVRDDPLDDQLVRDQVLWGTLLAGGAGVEYYYGYRTEGTDLTAQDHRTRDNKYTHASYALSFFNNHLQDYLQDMTSQDDLTSDNNDYVFAKTGEVYVVYRPTGGTTNITLPSGDWFVEWFNPRSGGPLTTATAITNSITAPDNNDWVALIKGTFTPGCIDNTVEATPLDDAYIQGGTTTYNTNELRTENINRVTFLKFVVPTTTEDVVATKLIMTVASDGGDGNIDVYKGANNTWLETTLNNTNKPTEDELIGSLNTTYTVGQSYEWVLTNLTQGETVSLILSQTGGNDVSFSSKEGSNAPKLVLEYNDCTLSVNEFDKQEKVIVFPNPANNSIMVENAKGTAKIYDIYGRTILSNIEINDSSKTIDISKLPSGMYFLSFKNKRVVQFIKK